MKIARNCAAHFFKYLTKRIYLNHTRYGHFTYEYEKTACAADNFAMQIYQQHIYQIKFVELHMWKMKAPPITCLWLFRIPTYDAEHVTWRGDFSFLLYRLRCSLKLNI